VVACICPYLVIEWTQLSRLWSLTRLVVEELAALLFSGRLRHPMVLTQYACSPCENFWKEEQKMKCGFRMKHFSRVRAFCSPQFVLTPLKSARKFMLPKRRFCKAEQKMKSRFSRYFSMVRSPNRVLTPLKSASFEIRISSLFILSKSSYGMDTFHRLFIHPKSSFGMGKMKGRSFILRAQKTNAQLEWAHSVLPFPAVRRTYRFEMRRARKMI